ncbi:unnamed protein product [Diamesa hyperborea]
MSDDYFSKPLSLGASPPAPSKNSPIINSPYLNFDPRYSSNYTPEFIFPEGASKQRGRFELAFSQIGSSVMIGGGIGGIAGFYNGVRATNLAAQTGKLRRTQLLNHVMKQGSATANTFGTVAVMYSAFGVLLQFARGEDDDINTVLAGGATGLLYKSTAGLKKCLIGGGVGLAISAVWAAYMLSGGSSKKFNDFKNYI